jgi:hypothetical protein
MDSKTAAPLVTALSIAAATAVGMYCGVASAAAEPDVRPLLNAAPSISFVYYRSAGMFLQTPTGVAGPGLITAMTKSGQLPPGAEMERAFNIPEPSSEIAGALTQRIKAATGSAKWHIEDHPHTRIWDKKPDAYKDEVTDPYVLELNVDGRGASYLPFNWKTYYYGLSARLRLIDVAQSKVVWEHHCNQSGLHGSTYKLKVEEFEANGGARLKEVEHAANDFCANELSSLLFAKGDLLVAK